SSVSPKSCRRSLWPTMTLSHPTSASIAALISPVKAPWDSQWQFWPATRTWLPTRACFTAASAVHGGAIPTSTPDSSLSLPRSSCTSVTASAVVLCIFQLPQMNALRTEHLAFEKPPRGERRNLALQRRQPRQGAALDELQ